MGAPVQADVPLPLAQRLARQIEAGGPISVAHYMAEANAHYYNSRDPLGAAGDFTTAPEISQMFGELVGLWLADIWIRSGRKDHPLYVRSEEHTSELQSLMRISYAVFCLKKKPHQLI